jgi:predicted transcriptional regulator
LVTAKLKNPVNHRKQANKTKGESVMVKLNKNDKLVLDALKDGELTLQEIADKIDIPSKKIFKILRKLFENELVDTKARKYRLIEK